MKLAGLLAAAVAAAVIVPATARADSAAFEVIAYSTALNSVADTELLFYVPATAPAPAKIAVSVPAGYRIATAAPGTTIASAVATLALPSGNVDVESTLVVDDPSRYASSTCAPGTHTAVWNVVFAVSGQSYAIPLFVDAASGGAAYTIEACLLSPDVPAAAGGAPAGARVVYLDFDFEQTFSNPGAANYHQWSAHVTPFAGGTATANPAATYELRSIVPMPEALSIKSRYDKKKKSFAITGRLVTVGEPESGAVVEVWGGASPTGKLSRIGSAKTDKRGYYAIRKKLTKSLWLTPYVPSGGGDCNPEVPSTAPAGCVLETWSPVFGAFVHAVLPRR